MTNQRRSALAFALIALLACADQTIPTEPHGLDVATSVSETNLSSAALDDAIARIIPSLADETRGPDLARAFSDLSEALSLGDGSMAGRLSRARVTLDAYENAGGEAADLSALSLALESVARRGVRKQ